MWKPNKIKKYTVSFKLDKLQIKSSNFRICYKHCYYNPKTGYGGQWRVPIPPKNLQNLHVSQEPLPSRFACFDGGGERKVAGPSRVGVDQVQCPLPLARHLGRMRTASPTTGSEHVKVGLQWKWIKYDKIPFDIIIRRNWGSRPNFQVVTFHPNSVRLAMGTLQMLSAKLKVDSVSWSSPCFSKRHADHRHCAACWQAPATEPHKLSGSRPSMAKGQRHSSATRQEPTVNEKLTDDGGMLQILISSKTATALCHLVFAMIRAWKPLRQCP